MNLCKQIHWPESQGLLTRIKHISAPDRKWYNLNLSDFEKLMSACMHDKSFVSDCIIIEVIFSEDLSRINSLQILSHAELFTSIDAYSHDKLSELIIAVFSNETTQVLNQHIACHVMGDIWLL